MDSKKGSLVVVGSGIKTVGHLTQEALAWIKAADKVFYVVSDPVAEGVIQRLNPGKSESLSGLYEEGKRRMETYEQMIERMMASVHAGMRTCAAYYGHPGVFAYPTHMAIKRLQKQGYEAFMLPGISAEDCLFAELGVDPATTGCQSYEATAFVINGHVPNPKAALILWQVGVFGRGDYSRSNYQPKGFHYFVEHLAKFYPTDHKVCIYESAMFPGCKPREDWVAIQDLDKARLTPASTLYIPASERAKPNLELLKLLESL
ncbi:SAM-dependent methyltransferase [Polyangium sp. 6x1]|uniref:SAM-dependent methyltransferase n=1 Tax=Polyangium sp. 6x1 TaxID=3042689 RepID=UPI00248256D3|nr:SAM-dependent methyltransferase [Polyangium sp. 6x1]MDI1448385.1 SAM-dependent methyltransferase [Polyangium sp. 6x1]